MKGVSNMEYTPEQRAAYIITECEKSTSKSPYYIFHAIAKMDFVRIHGPEHHVLDGACILTAFRNAGGKIELHEALNKLMSEIKCDFSPLNKQCIGERCPYTSYFFRFSSYS